MTKQIVGRSLILVVVFLLSFASQAAPPPPVPTGADAPAPRKAATAPATSAKPAWQEQWNKTLAAARKEGRLNLVGATGEVRSTLVKSFRAAYGIEVEATAGRGTQISAKVLAERRAGLYLHDIYLGGSVTPLMDLKPAGAWNPLSPALILPDVTDPGLIKKTWYKGQLCWLDRDRTVLSTALNVSTPIAINTNLVKEGEIRSWQDLLQPKWHGKIVLPDPKTGGTVLNFLVFVEERLGWDYFVELVKTKPFVLADDRLKMEWLAHGRVAVVVGPEPEVTPEFVRAGAPVRALVPEEGTWMSGGTGNLAVFNKSPHPNAGKVFVNWLLSKEGSTVLAKVGGFHMTRLDVPTDHLPSDQVRDPKGKYVLTLTEEVARIKSALAQKAMPLMAPLMVK